MPTETDQHHIEPCRAVSNERGADGIDDPLDRIPENASAEKRQKTERLPVDSALMHTAASVASSTASIRYTGRGGRCRPTASLRSLGSTNARCCTPIWIEDFGYLLGVGTFDDVGERVSTFS